MAVRLVRGVAVLFTLQTLWLLSQLPYWDLPTSWKISVVVLTTLQFALIWRLWLLRRWAVVYMIAETALKVVLMGILRDVANLGWQLYYLLMCITLAVVAAQEWKQLKGGI